MPSNNNGRGGPKKSDGKIADKVSKQPAAFFLCVVVVTDRPGLEAVFNSVIDHRVLCNRVMNNDDIANESREIFFRSFDEKISSNYTAHILCPTSFVFFIVPWRMPPSQSQGSRRPRKTMQGRRGKHPS